MKPKEIIYQSGIVNGVNARNQDCFLDLMMTELKNTYKSFFLLMEGYYSYKRPCYCTKLEE